MFLERNSRSKLSFYPLQWPPSSNDAWTFEIEIEQNNSMSSIFVDMVCSTIITRIRKEILQLWPPERDKKRTIWEFSAQRKWAFSVILGKSADKGILAEYIVVFKKSATPEEIDRYAQDVQNNGKLYISPAILFRFLVLTFCRRRSQQCMAFWTQGKNQICTLNIYSILIMD